MRIIVILFLLLSPASTQAFAPDYFQTEQAAQKHCPSDTVVWLNIPTGLFHFKGQRWYGRTKSGAFVCQKEANKEGDRATRNGQWPLWATVSHTIAISCRDEESDGHIVCKWLSPMSWGH